MRWMRDVMMDLRYAMRRLRRSPGFAFGVVFVLALGMGASSALFTILRATLLRPLAYAQPSRLVELRPQSDHLMMQSPNYLDVKEWMATAHTLSYIASYNVHDAFLVMDSGDSIVLQVKGTSNLFHTLGVQPQLGRFFTAEEQQPGHKVAVLSDALWRERFHADPGVLGKSIRIENDLYTVIGVAPKGLSFPSQTGGTQVWTPLELKPESLKRDFTGLTVNVIARLAPGTTTQTAAAEITGIENRLRPQFAVDKRDLLAPSKVLAVDYRQSLDDKARPALLAVSAAVGVLWLIACASAASLMLARGAARRHELAVRGALGARRGRLLRQFLVEGLLLAIASAVLGIVLSQFVLRLGSRVLERQLHQSIPHVPPPAVFGALLLLTIFSTLFFAVIPALLTTGGSLERAMREESERSGTSRARARLQRILVVAELSLTLSLVVSCGLLLRTVLALRHVPLGYRTDGIVVVEPKLPKFRYQSQDLYRAIYRPLLDRVQKIPGVQSAALSTSVPLSGSFDTNLQIGITGDGKAPRQINAKLKASTPDLQKVFGFTMAEGRWFNAQDTSTTPLVAVVNRAFAMRYGDHLEDVTKLHIGIGKNRTVNIVGVMNDFHQTGIAEESSPEFELDTAQMLPTDGMYQPTMQGHIELAVRTAGDPNVIIPELRKAMEEIDPAIVTSDVRTMQQVVDDAIGPQLLMARLLESFAALALVIALAGLYSLLSYMVTGRAREMGVRLALGAQRSDVLLLVLRSALVLLMCGVGCGIAASLLSMRLLNHFLYGVKAHDVFTMTAAVALMFVVGTLAAYLPARRAASLDPMQVLRAE